MHGVDAPRGVGRQSHRLPISARKVALAEFSTQAGKKKILPWPDARSVMLLVHVAVMLASVRVPGRLKQGLGLGNFYVDERYSVLLA